jgi:gamma-glutamylcyclotransferase (GGCT)/AIG2-like uncharacterized protein YtfP
MAIQSEILAVLKPLFVYGTLKKNEIAYHQIAELVDHTIPASLNNFALYIRDGIPLVIPTQGWRVSGELIYAKPHTYEELLKVVDKYEGVRLYERQESKAQLDIRNSDSTSPSIDNGVECYVYVGVNYKNGHAEPIHEPWSSSLDPIFSESFPELFKEIKSVIQNSNEPFPGQYDWKLYNDLAGKHLLLVTIIERIAYLKFGEQFTELGEKGFNDRVMKRITELGKTSEFKNAYNKVKSLDGIFSVEVFDSRNAARSLSTGKMGQAMDAWYQVRSNLQHRGKAAWRDFNILRNSLTGLTNVTRFLLIEIIPELENQIQFKELSFEGIIRIPDGMPTPEL